MIKINTDITWAKRNVASLWKEGKTITVAMSHGSEELLCVEDERGEEYFMFTKFEYSVHKRLFNKTMEVLIKPRPRRQPKANDVIDPRIAEIQKAHEAIHEFEDIISGATR